MWFVSHFTKDYTWVETRWLLDCSLEWILRLVPDLSTTRNPENENSLLEYIYVNHAWMSVGDLCMYSNSMPGFHVEIALLQTSLQYNTIYNLPLSDRGVIILWSAVLLLQTTNHCLLEDSQPFSLRISVVHFTVLYSSTVFLSLFLLLCLSW